MKKQKLTGWYPPEVKPVRVGWYHTGLFDKKPICREYQSDFNWYWNGKYWCIDKSGVKVPAQARYWRGIAK